MRSAHVLRGPGEGESAPRGRKRPPGPDGSLDLALRRRYGLTAGVDEVGRGALAGPVVAAAVALAEGGLPAGIDDSKRIARRRRESLDPEIRSRSICWAIALRDHTVIDAVNIVEATRQAMREAIASLAPRPQCVVVDALQLGDIGVPAVVEERADSRYLCVAAASIIAKVARDAIMRSLACEYPGYGWERNMGYATPEHLAALRRLGPSPLHRRSFAPVRVLAFQRG